MSLFSTSSTTSQTVQAGTFSVAPTINAVTQTVNAVTSTVVGTEAAVVNTAKSVVSTVVGTAESVVASAVSGVTTLFSSAENAVASAVNSTFSSLFGNSSSSKLSNVNTTIPDAVSSSFSGGTPKSTLFTASPISSQLSPVTFAGQTSSTTYPVSISSSISTLAARLGASATSLVTNGVSAASSAVVSSNALSGLYTDLVGVAQVGAAAATLVSTVSTDYSVLTNGIALSLTGSSTGLNSFYNSSLPGVATSTGSTITGVPSTTSLSTLNSLTSAASALGCSTSLTSSVGATTYGAVQSLYGALIALASELNINTLISDLLGCGMASTYSTSIASQLFYANAGTNAGTAYTLLNGISSSNISVTPSLLSSIVTNSNLVQSDTSYVTGMLQKLGVSSTSPYSTGTTVNGQTVFDTATVDSSPVWLVSTLAGSQVSTLQGGSALSLDTSDFGVAT